MAREGEVALDMCVLFRIPHPPLTRSSKFQFLLFYYALVIVIVMLKKILKIVAADVWPPEVK